MTFEEQRVQMVQQQLKGRGVTDPRVLAAFQKVPRQLFVAAEMQSEAYTDHPLPIGAGQTISQPYIVALMVCELRLQGHERVLEIGTGSGYEAAMLAELALEVFSVERITEFLAPVQERLSALGYLNVRLNVSDGTLGWPKFAPYDAIIVSAAAPAVPSPLVEQLAEGGRLVLPVGTSQTQMLVRVEKHHGTATTHVLVPCTFVPLVGTHGWPSVS